MLSRSLPCPHSLSEQVRITYAQTELCLQAKSSAAFIFLPVVNRKAADYTERILPSGLTLYRQLQGVPACLGVLQTRREAYFYFGFPLAQGRDVISPVPAIREDPDKALEQSQGRGVCSGRFYLKPGWAKRNISVLSPADTKGPITAIGHAGRVRARREQAGPFFGDLPAVACTLQPFTSAQRSRPKITPWSRSACLSRCLRLKLSAFQAL